jgi:hypothetical protein
MPKLVSVGLSFLLCSCAQTFVASKLVSGEYEYDNIQIVCRGSVVDPSELLKRSNQKILTYLVRNKHLSGAQDLFDYRRADLIGYMRVGKGQFVQFLFARLLQPEVTMLTPEGGVEVVMDACEEAIVYANYFKYPS